MRVFAAVLCAAACASAGAPSFTIDQVLSSPFPSSLTTNGHGKIAWVEDPPGFRNLWVAEAPNYAARQVATFHDHGIELGEVTISVDGSEVAFTRGEDPNTKGEIPNPAHYVGGTEQEVNTVPFSGGEVKKIGKGHSPALSPDGKTVAFVNADQVWSAPADGSGKAEQLIHARGNAESLEWSPDGKYLAFASRRAQHSFIAVYAVGDSQLRYLDPSVDSDAEPVWSADSHRVAFIRIATSQTATAFGPERAAETPWSIRVADADTCQGRKIWHADPQQGSEFHALDAPHQLLWADGDRIVFPWERTGYQHLYWIALAGGAAHELTPGVFEVESAALSPDRKSIVYASNQDDIDRRHVWRVMLDGGAPRRLTNGADIEWSAALPAGDDVAIFRSDAKHPAHASLITWGGVRDLRPDWLPGDFPLASMVEPEPVLINAADGMQIHGQLFLPHDGKSQHPAVIFFHGGSRRQMLLGWHYMLYYHQAYGFNQYLASRGYVVLSVNYRSGIGYGLDFREALNYGATGASEFNDVIGAGLYLRSRPDVIADKIGLWGGSYGGYLTALGLARASDLFAAGVDLHGVHEWNDEIQNFVPAYDPAKHAEAARVAFQSSPMAYIDTWRSPVLLIHGDDDRNVNFKQTEMLAEALRKQHVPFEQLIFPDEIHDLLMHQHWLDAYHAASVFLDRHLQAEHLQP